MINSNSSQKEDSTTTVNPSSSSPSIESRPEPLFDDISQNSTSLSNSLKRPFSNPAHLPSPDVPSPQDSIASTATETPKVKRKFSVTSHHDNEKIYSSPNTTTSVLLPKNSHMPVLNSISKSPVKSSVDSTIKHIAPKPPELSSNSISRYPSLPTDRHLSLSPSFGPAGRSISKPSASAIPNTNQSSIFSNSSLSRPRPIRSCTHCRQQKIKCNALEVFPAPCSRCARAERKCVIDPLFKPHKGGQVQSLRDDISNLKQQLAALKQRESALASALEKTAVTGSPDAVAAAAAAVLNLQQQQSQAARSESESPPDNSTLKQLLNSTTAQLASTNPNLSISSTFNQISNTTPITTSNSNNDITNSNINSNTNANSNLNLLNNLADPFRNVAVPSEKIPSSDAPDSRQASVSDSETHPEYYVVGDVRISHDRAEELHQRFMTQYLPFLPIIHSNSAAELYQQSQLLFWTVCLTASLSEPTPTLYNSLCSLIKQLAIETCWIQTPRSTHIVQALLILGNWPLPNEKVLDDCSYRFITLSKSLAMQLGLHRGKFIYEFSRTQVSLPDAEKWRTRTWIAIFVMEQVWCANLGLPPNMPMDYLLEQSRTDLSLPKSFRSLACLAMFCSKLVNLMGSSVTSPDGTLEPKNRFSTLGILEQELDRLVGELGTDDVFVEIYFLYLKMMICVFSFLPETPIQDQTIYIIKAYHAATRVVTLFSGLAEKRQIIEYPIYIRHPVSLAGFILFRLHLSPLLLPQYVESARQSVVTVHRLFRNMLTAWKDVQNDISRTAKIMEKLNFVIITHPELFTKASGIITRMRSHLTASLFYELIWAIHEARRRGGIGSSVTHTAAFVAARAAAFKNTGTIKSSGNNQNSNNDNNLSRNESNGNEANVSSFSFDSINSIPGSHVDSVPPLPFYNQITKEDFTTTTTTTPNGTTVTTLVPTNANMTSAQYGGGSTIIYGRNGVRIYTNENDTRNGNNVGDGGDDDTGVRQGPPTGDNAQRNVSGVEGVTTLAGIGHPSTMLTTGGPDVAGSLTVDKSGKGTDGSIRSVTNSVTIGDTSQNSSDKSLNNKNPGANAKQSFVPIPQFQKPLRINQIQNYSNDAMSTSKGGFGDLSSAGSVAKIQSSQLQLPTSSSTQQQQPTGLPTASGGNQGNNITPFYGTTGSSTDPLHLDTLMQGIDWLDPKGDDLLGWMDNFELDF